MSPIVTAGEITTAFGDACGNYMGGSSSPSEIAATSAAATSLAAALIQAATSDGFLVGPADPPLPSTDAA